MAHKIKYMNICLTNRCNLACVMCDIWREKDRTDLPAETVKEMLNARCLDNDLDITLTGGELFLHRGWAQIVEAILARDPRWLKGISTNGTRKEDTVRLLNDFGQRLAADFSFHISLDGINRHDVQRGKPSRDKVLDTVRTIRDLRPSMAIKIKFTITPVNYADIMPTFRFCRDNGLDFRAKLVENAANYTNRVEAQEFFFDEAAKNSIIRDLKEVAAVKLKAGDRNAMFIADTISFLQGQPARQSNAGPNRAFIMQDGDVFTCIHSSPLGNLHNCTLDEAWARNTAKQEECMCGVSYHGLMMA